MSLQPWIDCEHDPEHGAGLAVSWGLDKVVLHTTESGRGSLNAVRDLWRGAGNWGKGLPHFLIDGARVVQLLPLNVNAYTLRNPGDVDDTNRAGHVIQVEIVGRAAEGFNDTEYETIGRWIAALIDAGLNLDLDACPRFMGANEGVVLATESSPIRYGRGQWANVNTIVGHQHVRGNDHWDPGGIDIHRICDIVRRFTGVGRDWFDMATQDELRKIVREEVAHGISALESVQKNLAGVTRGDGGETRQLVRDVDAANLIELESVQKNLAGVIREVQKAGTLPASVDADSLAATVAGRLAVVAKPKPPGA